MRGSVQGLVVRPDGITPVADATVTMIRGPSAAPRMTVRSDDGGSFSIPDLAEGEWLLSAASGGRKSDLASVRVFENSVSELTILIAGGTQTGEVSMGSPETGSLRGRVVRARTGKPVANATITIVQGAGPAPDIAPVTDSSGAFALDGLPKGKWVLRAIGPRGDEGKATVQIGADSTASATIEIGGS